MRVSGSPAQRGVKAVRSTQFMLFVHLLLVVSVSSLPALADDTKKPAPKTPAAQQAGPKNNAGSATKGTSKDSKGANKDTKGKGGADTHKGTAGHDKSSPGGAAEQNANEGAPCSSGNAVGGALAGALGNAIGGTAGQLISGAVPCR